jgi:hypothetical protein
MPENPRTDVQDALGGFLKEGEIITGWCVVAEVADHTGTRLIHRAGGGAEGTEPPTIWEALGMLRAGEIMAEGQLAQMHRDSP